MTSNRLLSSLATLLLLKVVLVVLLDYRNYFPPNFASDFLLGRESTFLGGYRYAFYAHVLFGPIALVLGRLLISSGFRNRFRRMHRILGRVQAVIVLLAVAPSGLWMAAYTDSGVWAGVGFGTLAIATGTTVALGWRAAVRRRFVEHQQWMERCFWLLCSAVVLRMIGGLSSVVGPGSEWTYPIAAWLSWLGPLATYELLRRKHASNVKPTPREQNPRQQWTPWLDESRQVFRSTK